MIDRVHSTVDMLINTDGMGNVKPSDKDLAIHLTVLEMYEELLFDVQRMVNRQNRGLINGGLENIPNKLREKLQHYLMPDTSLTYDSGVFSLPNDLRYFDTVQYNTTDIELCKNNRDFRIIATSNPTTEYPIGLKQGASFSILPTSIISNVTVSYLRNPKQAKWTHKVIDGTAIFNTSANDFQDIDIHVSQEDDLIVKVLQKLGLNLKEKDIYAAVQNKEVREFNQENQS